MYDKTATNGAVYAVAGSSSKISGGNLNHPVMYLSLNELGSLVLDANSNRLDATFLGDTPTVLDAFTILKTVDSRRLTTSVLTVTGFPGAPGTSVEFASSSTGRVYTLQYADAPGGTWMNIPGQTDVTGAGGIDVLSDPAGAASSRIYRIRVRTPD